MKEFTIKAEPLLRCPFCGGDAVTAEMYNTKLKKFLPIVKCLDCECRTLMTETFEEAIKAWNTRVTMERIIERLEEESVLAEKEMDRAREQNPLQYERCDSYICAIDNAIEIVRECNE